MKNLIIYISFFARALSLLILAPILTKVLAPDVWGSILSAQSLATWLTLLLEFGFGLSLARDLVLVKGEKVQSRAIFGSVFSAKIILSFLALIITLFLVMLDKNISYIYLIWALILGVSQGFIPIWYFQARQQLYIYAYLDLLTRVIYFLLIYLLSHRGLRGIDVIIFQTYISIVESAVLLFIVYKQIGFWPVTFNSAISALSKGRNLAIFSLITSVYASASIFLFSLFASPVSVAVYGSADRLVRAGISVLGPLNQILLPKTNLEFANSHRSGIQWARRIAIVYGSISLLIFLIGNLLAPYIVSFLYGQKYTNSIIYLRLLLLLVPFVAINTIVTYHVFIPTDRSLLVNKIYTFVSFIAVTSIFLVVPKFQAYGMVFSMILPEVVVFFLLIYNLRYVYRSIVESEVNQNG